MDIEIGLKSWLKVGEAIDCFENDQFIKKIFSNQLIDNLVRTKRQELSEFKKLYQVNIGNTMLRQFKGIL